MYQDLPQGVKNSITRSIKTAFELYMYGIKWDPALYNMDDFMITWKNSFENGASWYTWIDADAKKDPAFHSALAEKVNQVIEKILTEAVTETQKKELEERFGSAFAKEVSCHMEAKYYLENAIQ